MSTAAGTGTGRPGVVRVYHSAVVAGWRERDRMLRRTGADVQLVSARRWDEGGAVVRLVEDGDDFVVGARTWGSHPNLFVYDPRPPWRAMRGRRIDILDVHEEPCSLAVAELRLLRRLLCPTAALVLYSAQNIDKRYPWPFRSLERGALHAASAVYVCNRAAGEILRRKGFRGRLSVLPLGVDVERFSQDGSGRPREAGAGLRIGYVGRLERRKGVQTLLDAIAPEAAWSLLVVGGGPYAGPLRDHVQAAGLGSRVEFRGYVPHGELPALYRSLDVLVVPSLPTPRWEEQFCRVAVEAMASSVPVVASASGALPEVVGEGGVTFPPGDAGALRRALAGFEDADHRRIVGDRARTWAEQFSWAAVATGHRRLYDEVLGAR